MSIPPDPPDPLAHEAAATEPAGATPVADEGGARRAGEAGAAAFAARMARLAAAAANADDGGSDAASTPDAARTPSAARTPDATSTPDRAAAARFAAVTPIGGERAAAPGEASPAAPTAPEFLPASPAVGDARRAAATAPAGDGAIAVPGTPAAGEHAAPALERTAPPAGEAATAWRFGAGEHRVDAVTAPAPSPPIVGTTESSPTALAASAVGEVAPHTLPPALSDRSGDRESGGPVVRDGAGRVLGGPAVRDGAGRDLGGPVVRDGAGRDLGGPAVTDGAGSDRRGPAVTDGARRDLGGGVVTDRADHDRGGPVVTAGAREDPRGAVVVEGPSGTRGGPSGDPGGAVAIPAAGGFEPEPAEPQSLRARFRSWRFAPLVEIVATVALALLLAESVQAAVVKPFVIPSQSMEPTLLPGQRVLVNRLAYDFGGTPSRGDIVVFHPPSSLTCKVNVPLSEPCPRGVGTHASDYFVKRVIGLPGDTLSIRNGHPVINGKELVDEPYITPCSDSTSCDMPHTIVIPPGDYYMLGDNRGDSDDSRYWGPVPLSWIIGEVFATYWPIDRIGLF